MRMIRPALRLFTMEGKTRIDNDPIKSRRQDAYTNTSAIMISMDILELFTVGYEGRQIETFINDLRIHGIALVIDVREIPISRKPGFSKSSLRANLISANIDYVHIKPLGSPTPIRHKLRADSDHEAFVESFTAYLLTQDIFIREALEFAKNGRSCLLCFERQAENCHRSIVAQRISELSPQEVVIHNL